MQKQINKLIEEKKLHRKTADKILALDKKEQGAILGFLDKFRLGINYSREFVGYLLDISKRDGVTVSTLLQETDISSLAEKIKLPHARKMELLREVLRRKRYPYYYGVRSPVTVTKPVSEPGAHFRDELRNRTTKRVSGPVAESANFEEMVFAKQKGSWLKPCPGTLGHICCNYLVINNISGCPFDCTYCYLHAYLNKPGITVFTNSEDLIAELKQFFKKNSNVYFRIGTGEFSDSLALDKTTGVSKVLVELFAEQNNHILELKTKSAEVDHLLDLDHKGKTVFAWSVNPEKIVQSEELGAVSLSERLKAARKCAAAGYKVGFHFDPIIFYSGWDKDYKEVVDLIFSKIDPKDVAWISLGALRYQPALKDIIEQRFPHSRITLGELDVGGDNKMRYFKPIRIEIFKKMYDFIRSCSKEIYVYLCMESADVWQASGIRNNSSNPYAKYFEFFKK